MSIVGPLVTPNKIETHFDRNSLHTRIFRHPVLWTIATLVALAAVGIATHIIPVAF